MSRRHRARRLALQGLCCLDVQGQRAAELVAQFIDDSKEPPETLAAAHKLLARAEAAREESDRILARHTKHWDLPRLAMVDRNILRLAVAEMRGGDTPPKVVISEAIRLAQEFSSAESPRFVNGVLDAVMKEMQASASDAARSQDQSHPPEKSQPPEQQSQH
jgi:N utilization substance protein B